MTSVRRHREPRLPVLTSTGGSSRMRVFFCYVPEGSLSAVAIYNPQHKQHRFISVTLEPGVSAMALLFDLARTKGSPIEIHLPPTGSVHVQGDVEQLIDQLADYPIAVKRMIRFATRWIRERDLGLVRP